MVDQTMGSLLTCSDEATLQFVQYLNSQSSEKFILQKLDNVHLFVTSNKIKWIMTEMDKFSDSNAYHNVGAEESGGRKSKSKH